MTKRYFGQSARIVVALLLGGQLAAVTAPAGAAAPGSAQYHIDIGTVDAISTENGTVVIDDKTYVISSFTRGAGSLRKGARVQFQYVVEGGLLVLQTVQPPR